MNVKTTVRGLLAWGMMGSLFVFIIWDSEGISGFKPFINVEAFLLVFLMTFLMLWVSYPFTEIFKAAWAAFSGASLSSDDADRMRDILNAASRSAMAAGATASILAMIMMLSSVSDISSVPRRMGLDLATLFFAFVLSEFVFVPMSRRFSRSSGAPECGNRPDGQIKKQFLGLLSLGVILLSYVTIIIIGSHWLL